MDRETLIAKLKGIGNLSDSEMNVMSDEELMSYYMDLEDSGKICDYSD